MHKRGRGQQRGFVVYVLFPLDLLAHELTTGFQDTLIVNFVNPDASTRMVSGAITPSFLSHSLDGEHPILALLITAQTPMVKMRVSCVIGQVACALIAHIYLILL